MVFRPEDSRIPRAHLYEVAGLSLLVVGVCLFPLVASGMGLPVAATWRLASLALGIAWPLGWLLSTRRVTRAGARPIFGRLPFSPDTAANLAGLLLLWWNVFLPSGGSGWRYIAATVALLSIAGMSFIAAAFGTEPDEPAA